MNRCSELLLFDRRCKLGPQRRRAQAEKMDSGHDLAELGPAQQAPAIRPAAEPGDAQRQAVEDLVRRGGAGGGHHARRLLVLPGHVQETSDHQELVCGPYYGSGVWSHGHPEYYEHRNSYFLIFSLLSYPPLPKLELQCNE